MKQMETALPYVSPQCGIFVIQTEQILCSSGDIDDFDRVDDDWV
jgi:hypothetical protein